MEKKDCTEEGWMKPRWTQGKLQKPQVMFPQAQRQTQGLSKPSRVCSGRLFWQLCPGAESFWPLLSNFLGCQCCSSNDMFFMGLFQLCYLMKLSQISLGSWQKKKRGFFYFESALSLLCYQSWSHYSLWPVNWQIKHFSVHKLFLILLYTDIFVTWKGYIKHIHDSLWSLDYS